MFQDKHSERMIGHAREWNSLYYLDNSNLPSKLHNYSRNFSSSSDLIKTNWEKVLLQHCYLGHPSFRVIKLLFIPLYNKLDVESLHCKVCELVKHKSVPFPVSNKMSTSPFYLILIDVWGPSNISNVFGSCWFITLY